MAMTAMKTAIANENPNFQHVLRTGMVICCLNESVLQNRVSGSLTFKFLFGPAS